MMMRIGVDARFLGTESSYGLAQYSESLLQALSRADAKNHYRVFVNAGLKRKLKLGDNFEIIPVQGRPLSARGLARFILHLRRERLDLLHAHFPLVPLGVDLPTLITVHDVVPFRRPGASPDSSSTWDHVAGLFIYPMTMHRARWILCVSNATRDKLLQLFPEVSQKVIVRTSGVEDLYHGPLEAATADLVRARLALPERYVLYSGSLGEDKNVTKMLQAFSAVGARDGRTEQLHFVLDVTGGPRGLSSIAQTIRRLNLERRVHILTGLNAHERRVVFENAAVLFIVSKEEGFGLPALKAQMVGVPVLAADAGALPEVCGPGAVLVDPDDLDQIAEALDRVLFDVNLRRNLAELGRRNATRFSWNDTARQVKQIYELLF